MGDGSLILRPLTIDDEVAFVEGHRAMQADDFEFGLGFDEREPFAAYITSLDRQRRGIDLPDGLVPATFLVADVDNTIVGRISIRHELNDYLARFGGHIGYGVLPGHRRRGHATEMLRQGLVVARTHGVGRVLVTCDEDNAGSAAVIEACGGVYESSVSVGDGGRVRRYWIDR